MIYILDNSGIDYSRMLFVLFFLFTGKLIQILAPTATPGLRLGYKVVTSKLSKKCNVEANNILGFITINNIFTPFFNWKITAIHFVSVIDYY